MRGLSLNLQELIKEIDSFLIGLFIKFILSINAALKEKMILKYGKRQNLLQISWLLVFTLSLIFGIAAFLLLYKEFPNILFI